MALTVSPEFSLVAACALAPDAQLVSRAHGLCSAVHDWDQVERFARHHSVLAMLGGRLEKLVPGLLPVDLVAAARTDRTRNLALHTAQAHQTARLTYLLETAGLRTLVLKGVPLARMLYPENPEWRYSSDIDLLIDPSDLHVADEALCASGFVRTWPSEVVASRLSPQLVGRFAKDYQYLSSDGAHHVELHFRLALNPHVLAVPFEEALDSSEEIDAGFGPMRAFDGPLLLPYLAWHAAADIDFGLKWFADLAWARRNLKSRGISAPLSAMPPGTPHRAVGLVDRVNALLVEANCADRTGQAWRICRSMDALVRVDKVRRTLARLPREASTTAFQMGLVDGWRAKGWFLWRVLVDPRDAVTLGGRSLPGFVYALAGPFLSAWRFLRRSRVRTH